MAKTTIPVELSSTPGITDNSNANAITIDSSENVTFTGDVQATGVYVGSTNTSYDFYNNGTSYFNGAVTVDADLSLTSGGGIFLGGTGSANKLTDYEEGTWTPTFSGATLATADGSYTKIGNQVTVHFRVITSGGLPTSSSQVQVGGLPFTAASGFGGVGGLYVGPSNVSSATGGGGTIIPYITGGEDFIRFLNVDTGTFGYTTWGELEVSHNNVVTAIGTQTYQV